MKSCGTTKLYTSQLVPNQLFLYENGFKIFNENNVAQRAIIPHQYVLLRNPGNHWHSDYFLCLFPLSLSLFFLCLCFFFVFVLMVEDKKSATVALALALKLMYLSLQYSCLWFCPFLYLSLSWQMKTRSATVETTGTQIIHREWALN